MIRNRLRSVPACRCGRQSPLNPPQQSPLVPTCKLVLPHPKHAPASRSKRASNQTVPPVIRLQLALPKRAVVHRKICVFRAAILLIPNFSSAPEGELAPATVKGQLAMWEHFRNSETVSLAPTRDLPEPRVGAFLLTRRTHYLTLSGCGFLLARIQRVAGRTRGAYHAQCSGYLARDFS